MSTRFVLHHAGGEIPLRPGEAYVIGRSVDCKIVLSDHMVSRRHARLIVGVNLLIEDLGSANGVYVDGRRIQTIRRIGPGQRVQIGGQELLVGTAEMSERARIPTHNESLSRRASVPPRGSRPSIPAGTLSGRNGAPSSSPTDRVNFPEVLLELTGRLLSQGRADEAEKLIADYLADVLARWRLGSPPEIALSERCAERALGLAAATGKSSWLDYVFELYAAMDALLPEQLINESYRVVRLVRRPSMGPIRSYVKRLDLKHGAFNPSERFLLKRLHGLEHMTGAR